MSNIELLLEEMRLIRDLLELMTEQKETKKRKSKAEALDLYSKDFEYLWRHYPKKIGKRKAARALVCAIRRCEAAEPGVDWYKKILRAVKRYKVAWPASRVKSEGTFCLHLSTFLNNDRFEDDPHTWGKEDPNGQGNGGPRWIVLD